tara:strand:+ start:11501 stop:13543 length:2043 start_codon:yes stop_codon:yes gene_type:complete
MTYSKITAIIQARMGSTRLPGKVLKRVSGKSLIEILLFRLAKSKKINKIIVAIPKSKENDSFYKEVKNLGFEVFRGSENNVLKRFYLAVKSQKPEIVLRITGDCPLIDGNLVDEVIKKYEKSNVDYVSNTDPPTFPDGLDTEVFSFAALEKSYLEATLPLELEHVTPYMRENNTFLKTNLSNDKDLSKERWTVDEYEDLDVVKNIINYFHPRLDFSWHEILNLKQKHPEYFLKNRNIKRNEGSSELIKGQKLWQKAKKNIPGGNMLLSKRPDLFLPDKWPAYYSKAKGCKIWDLDGNEFIDMTIMGIGTNILGYGHPEIDEEVTRVVLNGNMSTLNCPEEVYLVDQLKQLHPWFDMARFARSGGEANSIAIRIARAATGKDNVAICGYHGWHDWYLSANLNNNSELDGHLLPGLKPKGVPRNLLNTTYSFKYNDLEHLEYLVKNCNIGTIKMEVMRNEKPTNHFLEKVRKLSLDNNIVLIFDECTSGFRETYGGLHIKYNVKPDLAMFGKALGNGYAITAVIGKEEIMQYAQETFISSTFWTERIGPSAALKTLEVMEKEKSWQYITSVGKSIDKGWKKLAKKYNLKIETTGIPALIHFTIKSKNWIKYKTFITQEMLKKGFLAANSIYVCTEHTNDIIERYFDELDPIFKMISRFENKDLQVDNFLDGPVCQVGFNRLN